MIFRMVKEKLVGIITCLLLLFNVRCSGKVPTTNEPVSTIDASTTNNATTASPVDGTTGTPLGGFGAGAVKFCGNNGTFAAITQPPADKNDYKKLGATRFQLYTDRNGNVQNVDTMKALLSNGRYDDDAIWPEHIVNFGSTNDIQVNLKAFSPFDNVNYDNMSMPYAFYEMTVKNNGPTAADAALAFLIDGSDSAAYVAGKGLTSPKWSVYAESSDSKAVISAGSDNGFTTDGLCNDTPSGTQNKVAVKVSLAASETKTIKFVLSWYDNTDPERAYYLGLYNNSGDIADRGLKNFDSLKVNADKLVNNMRSSNLPDWLKNQTLNTLVNLTNNSIYKKDGRIAFAEGEWTCFGTMDQMWHARQIVSELLPDFAWKELEYWARTQMLNGQIHHDANSSASDKSILAAWDDTAHADYRNVSKWVDLNCGFIVSIFETYQATNNQKELDKLWPNMKKAAQRILDQVKLYGDKTYPYTFDSSENSYDAGGDPNPFNASLSAVAYKIMVKLAQEKGETDVEATYQKAYDTVVASYKARYLNSNFPVARGCESFFGGQWLAMNLKLSEIWSKEDTDLVLEKLDSYYHPYYWGLGHTEGTYNEWTPYLLTHYGGLLLNTGRADQWAVMQKDAYYRQYYNRNKVFNQPLDILPAVTTPNYAATDISGDKQYISMSSIWRNYYDIVGYHRDNHTNEIWVEPIILDEMNHKMTNAMYVSPEGYGTINCTESGTYNQNKDITVKSENPIAVSTIHLTDSFGKNVKVKINGKQCKFTRSGDGYTKELLVNWNGTINNKGIRIVTSGDAGSALAALPAQPAGGSAVVTPPDISAYNTIEAEKASESAGTSTVTSTDGVQYVTSCNNFDYIKFNNVGFDTDGSAEFTANVSSTINASKIDIVLDSVGGETIGTMYVPNTGGNEKWVTVKCPIKKITGTHNIILKFSGKTEDNLMNIDNIKFNKDGVLNTTGWVTNASINSQYSNAAIDGDSGTNWSTENQKSGDWWSVDMGSVNTFDKINLYSSYTTDYPRGYEVYLSIDGINWGTPIATGTGTSNKIDISFTQQKARYIKIEQTSTANKYWRISEINVYNSQAGRIALQNIIDANKGKVQTDYTADSWAMFEKSTSDSQAALEDKNSTPEQLNNYAVVLYNAANTLIQAAH